MHGERKFEKEEKEENYRRVERQYGSFTRSFTLPNTVDQESVQADYDKGVLKVKLAKKAEAKPKQIKVNVGWQRQREDAGRQRAEERWQGRVSECSVAAVNFGGRRRELRLPFHFVIWQSGKFCKLTDASCNRI